MAFSTIYWISYSESESEEEDSSEIFLKNDPISWFSSFCSIRIFFLSEKALLFIIIFWYFFIIGFKSLFTEAWCEVFMESLKMKENVDPLPNSERTQQFPPNYWVIIFEMWRPRPIPFVFMALLESKKPKSLNNYDWSLCFMPIPVSITEMSTIPPCILVLSLKSGYNCSSSISDYFWMNLQTILMEPPEGVNFKALDWRFKRIY